MEKIGFVVLIFVIFIINIFGCYGDKSEKLYQDLSLQPQMRNTDRQSVSVANANCNCENGKCEKDSSGKLICICPPEYGLSRTRCKPCNCGPGANCTIDVGFFSDTVECICPKGIRKGADKRCENPCSSKPCKNNGTCKIDYNGMKCECTTSYTGDYCEIYVPVTTSTNEYFTSGFNETTLNPTNFSLDFNETTNEQFNFTISYTETILNYTRDLNETTFEQFTYTYGYNETTDEPLNFTYDFNKTSYTPFNYTNDFNETTYEPSNYTHNFNETTYNPFNYTNDFNETTYEPSNYTYNFNETTYSPFNYTIDFNETTYEPYNFTIFRNETYEPLNYTDSWNFTLDFNKTTEEFNYTIGTTGEPPGCTCGINSIACKYDIHGNKYCLCKPGFSQLEGTCQDCYCGKHSYGCYFDIRGRKSCICQNEYGNRNGTCSIICENDNDCLNSGKCVMDYYNNKMFCNCINDYYGDRCEYLNPCKRLEPMCTNKGAVCRAVDGKPRCECPPEKIYKHPPGICEDICTPETCFHGRCEIFGRNYKCSCDEGYAGERCDVTVTPKSKNHYKNVFITLASFVFLFLFGALCFILVSFRLRRKRNAGIHLQISS